MTSIILRFFYFCELSENVFFEYTSIDFEIRGIHVYKIVYQNIFYSHYNGLHIVKYNNNKFSIKSINIELRTGHNLYQHTVDIRQQKKHNTWRF